MERREAYSFTSARLPGRTCTSISIQTRVNGIWEVTYDGDELIQHFGAAFESFFSMLRHLQSSKIRFFGTVECCSTFCDYGCDKKKYFECAQSTIIIFNHPPHKYEFRETGQRCLSVPQKITKMEA